MSYEASRGVVIAREKLLEMVAEIDAKLATFIGHDIQIEFDRLYYRTQRAALVEAWDYLFAVQKDLSEKDIPVME